MTSAEPSGPRIALIHALAESVQPISMAFKAEWPEAYAFDLLDTSLAVDRAHRGTLDADMFQRFRTLADYATGTVGLCGRAKGILFTCSAFGPTIDALKSSLPIPVLRPNESAFREALSLGDEIGLVVSFGPSLSSLSEEIEAMAAAAGRRIRLKAVLAAGALDALKSGDGAAHDMLIAEAARSLGNVDALVLGQFSMARAAPRVREVFRGQVLTTPDCAVRELRTRVAGASPMPATVTHSKETNPWLRNI